MTSRTACPVISGCMLMCCVAVAQSAPEPGTPASRNNLPAAQAVGNPPGQPPTVKATAQLVLIDVVVTDSAHRPVHGLAPQDFTITEDGLPQKVKSFEERTSSVPSEAAKLAASPKMPPGIYTNFTPAQPNGSVNLLLLDLLNTPLGDQVYVRQQIVKYLRTAEPGARMAVFGLTTHLLLLQGFTTDPEALRAVVLKTGGASQLLDDTVGGSGIQNSVADDAEDSGMVDPEIVANLRDFEAESQSVQLQLRAKYTLDAMNQLAKYLSMIPGRKNVIWVSGSFPISILPDVFGKQANPFIAVADSEDEFRQTVRLLAKAQVAVYPVDARGLFNSSVYSAETTRNYSGRNGVGRMQQDQTDFLTQTAQEHGTMEEMAAATGGRAFVNMNGLADAVRSAVDDGSNFYTLSYTPTNSALDGRLRKIKVQVNKPGAKLAYRQGYYADRPGGADDLAKRMNAAAAPGERVSASDALRLAMMRGAPVPTEIVMKVGVTPITPAGQTEDSIAKGNVASEKIQGPYRRYGVNYAIDPADISFIRTSDGLVHGDMDLLIFVYSASGEFLNRVYDEIHIAAPLDQVRKAAAHGLNWHEEVSTPANGEYFLRIAVRDQHRDQYGAVEMATSDVRNVKPIEPVPTKPDVAPGKPAASPAPQ